MANVTSSIKLRRATGSIANVPTALSEGEFAINLLSGKLYYGAKGGGSNISSSFEFEFLTASYISVSNTLTARNLTITNTASINYLETIYESSSIIYTSGSTTFGNTSDDTHLRTGSMLISGGLTMDPTSPISASVITASHLYVSGMDNSSGGTPSKGSGFLRSGSLRADGPITFHNSLLGSASIFSTQSGGVSTNPTTLVISGNLVLEKNAHLAGTNAATASLPRVESSHISASVISASEYFGVTKTQYQTGSTSAEDLLNLKILNFDTNIFVASDPATGQLTLQFGEASLPTTTLKLTGNKAVVTANTDVTFVVDADFNDDRFSGQSQSAFVFTHSISNVPESVTLLTHSFFINNSRIADFEYKSGSGGFPDKGTDFYYLISAPGTPDPEDPPTSGGEFSNGRIRQIRSGSSSGAEQIEDGTLAGLPTRAGNSITASYFIKDGTGTIVTMSDSKSFDLDKDPPNSSITLTFNVDGIEGVSEFVDGGLTSNITIENGITGSVTYTTNSLAGYSNLWAFDSTSTGSGDGTPHTLEVTSSTKTFNITANYTSSGSPGTASFVPAPGAITPTNRNLFATISSGSGTPKDNTSITRARSISRRTSIRHFTSPTASFTEKQLWDIKGAWTSSVFSASIRFDSTENPNGVSFSQPIPAESAYPAGLYAWIVYSDDYENITGLTQNGQAALGNWSKVHDYPTYKAYRTNNLQSQDNENSGAGSTFVITI